MKTEEQKNEAIGIKIIDFLKSIKGHEYGKEILPIIGQEVKKILEEVEAAEVFPRWEGSDILHLHYATVNLSTGNTVWAPGKFTPQRQNAIIHSIANAKNVNAEALNKV